jgi:hypothetical protein
MDKFYFIIVIILILLFHDKFKNINNKDVFYVGEYKTKFFQSDSKEFLEFVKEKKFLSEESLEELAMMEDQFLSMERETVCAGLSRYREATALDQQMKDRYISLSFKHHEIHLRQMSQPSKLINKNLHCS